MDQAAGFRRRSRRGGTAVLVDEAAVLLASDPALVGAAVVASAPLAIVVLAHALVVRTFWLDLGWEDGPLLGSAAFGLATVAAYALRGLGHGRIARMVVARLHPDARDVPTGLPRWSLASAALLAGAFTLAGATLMALPGVFVAGRFADVPGVIAVEGHDVHGTLARRGRPGATVRGAMALAYVGALGLLLWGHMLVGAQLVALLVRALGGFDAALLFEAVSPANVGFLVTSATIAFVLMDPLWAVLRAILYLDGRLGRSGADLDDRWAALGKPGASILAVAFSTLVVVVPGVASAMDALEHAEDLSVVASEIDALVASYDTSGWESTSEVHELGQGLVATVTLGDGRETVVDARVLLDDLPEQIHDDGTRRRARRVQESLEEAAGLARGLESTPRRSIEARAALDRVLADGGYDVERRTGGAAARRRSIRERIRTWLEGFVEEEERRVTQRAPSGLGFDPAILGALFAIVAVAVVLILLGVRFGEPRRRPRLADGPELEGAPGALPDARAKSPGGWTDHAVSLFEQGRYREAVRAHYLSVLAALDRARTIDYRPERTNGALLRGFRGADVARERFASATRRFERAWYGEQEVEPEDVDAMAEACRDAATPSREDAS